MIPAGLAAETRLLMKRGDTVASWRPTTGPLAQTLRFHSERRTTSLVTVSSAPPVELVSDREFAASLSHTGPGLSDGLQSVVFGDVDAVSAIYPDPQEGPVVSDVVLSGSTPDLCVSSRDTCVPPVVAQVRQRSDPGSGGVEMNMNTTGPDVSDGSRETRVSPVEAQLRQLSDPDSGGLGPHSNLRGVSDVSRALSTSTGVYDESTPSCALSGDFDAVSTIGHAAPTDDTSLTLVSPDAEEFEGSELGGESRPRSDILSDPALSTVSRDPATRFSHFTLFW